MAQQPRTVLHRALASGTAATDTVATATKDIAAALAGLAGKVDRINAVETRLDKLEHLVADVLSLHKDHWQHRLMIRGIDPISLAFLPNDPVAALLIAAKCPSVAAVANATSGRRKKPWEKIRDDMQAVYLSDTNKYTPPPDYVEMEAFYNICVANK